MRVFSLVLVGILGGSLGAQTPPAPVVPEVAMEDQFERPQNVAAHRGHVVVLIYGDRRSADANKALGEALHVHFHPSAKGQPPAQARMAPVKPVEGAPAGAKSPDVVAVAVACVGKVPALVQKMIRSQIRKGSPDVPVWLDFQDVMRERFPFTASVPNVAVLDAHGRYRHASAGTPTPASQAKLIELIESLRKEAVTPRP